MTSIYIHERADWPKFRWDAKGLAPLLSGVRLRQGLLLGKMQSYGFASQWTATLKVLTEETIKSSAIEGVVLNPGECPFVDREEARSRCCRTEGAQRPKCRRCGGDDA